MIGTQAAEHMNTHPSNSNSASESAGFSSFSCSNVAFFQLFRSGFLHHLWQSLIERVREEDEGWTLAFQLEEEEKEPNESVNIPG